MFIPIATFVVVSLVFFGLAWLLLRRGRNRDHEVLAGSGSRPLIFGPLTEALAGVVPSGEAARDKLRTFLRQAGHYHRLALAEFLALRNTLVVGWVILTATALVVVSPPSDGRLLKFLIPSIVGVFLLYSLPRLILETMAKARLQRIEHSLPDALDMITMCMSGGLPMQRALRRVSEEMKPSHPDLAFELKIVERHMETGSVERALSQFAKRIDTPDVHSLAAIIAQTDQQGASVAAAFHEYADGVRLSRRQRADEMGNKTAVKMLFPLVFCLAPPVYIMLLSPAVLELSEFVSRENRPGGVLSASVDDTQAILQEDRDNLENLEAFPLLAERKEEEQ